MPVRVDTVENAWLNVDYGLTPDVGDYYFGGRNTTGDVNSLMLSREDAYELYTQCIVPDLQFSMNLCQIVNGEVGGYGYFYTVPTVDSVRTNAWLTEHGVVLETLWDYLERTGNTDALYQGEDMPTAVPEYITYK